MSIIEEKQTRDRLLASVKKEVKQLMEEAVTKKFVHEDSACLTSLCAMIEQCLLHGLKRRSVGLFKTSTTMALLQKLSKNFEPSEQVVKMCDDYEEAYCNGMNTSINLSMISRKLFPSTHDTNVNSKVKNFAPTFYKGSNCYKYLWIRLALLNKLLIKIIEHIVSESDKFYESYALVADPVDGPIFSSLLVGPCALEYTRLKTCDHLWTDPNADELIQRYKMHNNFYTALNSSPYVVHNNSNHQQSPKQKLGLNASIILKRNASTNLSIEESSNLSVNNSVQSPSTRVNIPTSPIAVAGQSPSSNVNNSSGVGSGSHYHAKEYVESLHQNSKSQLIYGKNYVIVYPKEEMDGLPGYLSLHLNVYGLTLKWTPNQLMNGSIDDNPANLRSKNLYWDYAINVDMNSIVYVHCHQQTNNGATIVLVGHDGVQYPPICFPKGSHLLQFLTCLENGLAPNGSLDPPLWSDDANYKEKTFPKMKDKMMKKNSMTTPSTTTPIQDVNNNYETKSLNELEDFEPKDFVFRIIHQSSKVSPTNTSTDSPNIFRNFFFNSSNPLASLLTQFSSNDVMKSTSSLPGTCPSTPAASLASNSSSTKELTQSTPSVVIENMSRPKLHKSLSVRSSMKLLCDTMKHQILSRAFYGWLAYCRHLKTIRLHLIDLVNNEEEEEEGDGESENVKSSVEFRLTSELWAEWLDDEKTNNTSLKVHEKIFYKNIYYGGIEHDIRKQVWPFLLQHYTFDMTEQERAELDVKTSETYKRLVEQWKQFEEHIRSKEVSSKLQSLNDNNHLTSTVKITPNSINNKNQSPSYAALALTPITVNTSQTSLKLKALGNNNHQIIGSLANGKNTIRNDLILLRKDSSLSNDVFMEDVKDLNNSIENDVNLNDSNIPEESNSHSSLQLQTPPNEILNEGLLNYKDDDTANETHNETVPTVSSRRSSACSFMSFDDSIAQADTTQTNETGSEVPSVDKKRKSFSDKELIENFTINMHRIDKDVTRCDRNYYYFTSQANLQKLRDIMYTYVWENLSIGYIQGMCDLVAPLLVIFDDEAMAYSCFKQLMKRMGANFPHGTAMDKHFSNMRSLIQILDSNLYEHMHQRGDYTHFYFSYRWFLLDFKRELLYDDVFTTWETIWSAQYVCTNSFSLFIALALVETYRDIIIDNNMDFTDIIKFFNEMAEKHNAKNLLQLSRDLVKQLQNLIHNKDDYN